MEICLVCGDNAEHTFYAHGERISICAKHYEDELCISLELWENVHGSCCLECGKLVHQFVVANPSLPCLCVKHLAKKMRHDSMFALLVCSLIPTDEQIKVHDEVALKEVGNG